MTFGEITLKHLITGCLLQNISNQQEEGNGIKEAEDSHTDLIPGIYEGGAKIWECTNDLLQFLTTENKDFLKDLKNKRVLDLGCGSGLLGILAYKCGSIVHFQDYNQDVIKKITMPNLILNIPVTPDNEDLELDKLNNCVQFYSGDWEQYTDLVRNSKESVDQFDVILTSETIYNPDNQQKLIDTFLSTLSDDGVVYVAAKTYYFGVGGGMRQFETLAQKSNFETKTVWLLSNDGLSREIIVLHKSKVHSQKPTETNINLA